MILPSIAIWQLYICALLKFFLTILYLFNFFSLCSNHMIHQNRSHLKIFEAFLRILRRRKNKGSHKFSSIPHVSRVFAAPTVKLNVGHKFTNQQVVKLVRDTCCDIKHASLVYVVRLLFILSEFLCFKYNDYLVMFRIRSAYTYLT